MQKENTENTSEKKAVRRWSAGKWLLFTAALLVVLAAVPVADELIPRKVTVRYITFDGEVEEEYETRAHKVSEFMAEHEYEIADADMVLSLYEKAATEPDLDSIKEGLLSLYLHWTGKWGKEEPLLPFISGYERSAGSLRGTSQDAREDMKDMDEDEQAELSADAYIQNGMTIRVKKAEKKTALIGGKKRKLNMYPGEVADTLWYNGISWDEDDEIRPALRSELDFDDKIKITRVKVVTEEKEETIEPEEKGAVFDRSLASGTIARTEGKPGTAVYKYTYKFVNGKKKKTEKKFDRWIRKPTHIQLRFGTSVTGETGEVNFSETFIGNCTAYYFGNNAHGATGGRCHYGTCAVDPKVIPYGTRLYVEGYGIAVANDCGGAVKGHIIDLYMRSTKECFSWGRRNRKVYVLE